MAVLIVEPNPREAQNLAESVRGHGLTPLITNTAHSALNILKRDSLDLVLLTLNGHKPQVTSFIETSRSMQPKPPVIVMAEKPCVDDATLMMKLGAYDFWVKPVQLERLDKTLQILNTPADAPRPDESPAPGPRPLVAQNPRMLELKALARRIAATGATVLIQGESGTGKELFARYIHQQSDRCHKPFVALNTAALPEGLLESELFGHERGAFTGAVKSKEGKFELAHGGTLLLDEITEIPVHLQAKLLRVLQESEVDRVGGRYPIPVDVRVIATTNTDVETAVAEGRFRKDLYYRLNVIPLKIPPLRDRPDDLLHLSHHFLDRYSRLYGCRNPQLPPAALQKLQEHSWPGNVRELENVIQRAVLLTDTDALTPESLIFDDNREPDRSEIELMPICKMEQLLIGKALDSVQGNRTKAAEILGISVRTLRNKLNEYRQNPV